MQASLKILEARIRFRSGDGQGAISLLADYVEGPSWTTTTIQRRLIETNCALSGALQTLAADAVHCVLAETTIAFPSVQTIALLSGKQQPFQKLKAAKAPGRARRVVATNGQGRVLSTTPGCDCPSDIVKKAMESLLQVTGISLNGCPTNVLREVFTVLDRCFMLSSVLLQRQNGTPFQIALQATLPNCMAMNRENLTISSDLTLTDASKIPLWPDLSEIKDTKESPTVETPLLAQSEIVDTLPEDWTIISLRLSQDKEELSITKFHVGQIPFSLRIPLRRSSSEEPDAKDFDFPSAKAELLDIIRNGNLTAHDSRDHSDKAARKTWWAEREALDERLKTLLENIENIWLGGFRGILSHQRRQEALLSRLSGSLNQSLNQHLPSRQKNKGATSAKVKLHAHVLDLFVTLGHPNESELDDSISDLLYFVVDILQFQGEHNAYDEIDFDMITIEVQDALRCYHEALKDSAPEHPQHTILILDKELLAIPWESLPCLEGQAVCRMPSLSSVKSRLDRMRLQDPDAVALHISKSDGAYVLNPSSDLTSTQATFADTFSTSIPNFTSIINRAPTEPEVEACLRDHELFLYFGHGSGAQYIRGRNIKRLEKCAVTLLMGCSSGKMTECGQFEPYGVPWNYMHANAPAVVGTLWDVTDKDIDRFAMKVFTNWGLVSEQVAEEAVHGKKKGKQNVKSKAKKESAKATSKRLASGPAVTLDEAVADARDSCVLRYLNGAAPVIYGIPVVLD